jgi:hypothetical protein
MCVILYKKAGHTIEDWRLKSAVQVNPDGWGYSIPLGEGKLLTKRCYDEKGNSAELIEKAIEKHKNEEMFIHLRYKTHGDKSLLNCHPFTVLTKRTHGIDLQFMHNGTIAGFSSIKDSRSDTKQFVDAVLTPLMERILAFSSPEKAIFDKLLPEILDQYAGFNNKFVLVDGFGSRLFVNEHQGKTFDWGWASNEYSFNQHHRAPAATTATVYPTYKRNTYHNKYGGSSNPVIPFQKNTSKSGQTSMGAGHTEKPLPPLKNPLAYDPEHMAAAQEQIQKLNDRSTILFSKDPQMPQETARLTFCQLMDLEDLAEVACFNEQDIQDLIQKEPDFALLLIQDLRDALFFRHKNEAIEKNLKPVIREAKILRRAN